MEYDTTTQGLNLAKNGTLQKGPCENAITFDIYTTGREYQMLPRIFTGRQEYSGHPHKSPI